MIVHYHCHCFSSALFFAHKNSRFFVVAKPLPFFLIAISLTFILRFQHTPPSSARLLDSRTITTTTATIHHSILLHLHYLCLLIIHPHIYTFALPRARPHRIDTRIRMNNGAARQANTGAHKHQQPARSSMAASVPASR